MDFFPSGDTPAEYTKEGKEHDIQAVGNNLCDSTKRNSAAVSETPATASQSPPGEHRPSRSLTPLQPNPFPSSRQTPADHLPRRLEGNIAFLIDIDNHIL